MSLNPLDVLLLVVLLAYAVSGYWQGFITGAFATVGLLAGGLFGMLWLAPRVLDGLAPSVWVTLGALLIVLACASLGQGLLQLAGSRIRARIQWQPARALDAVGGAALSVVAVLVVAWALGVAVSGARLHWVTQEVNGSRLLQRVNQVMPARAVEALNTFNNLVGSSFPRYLEPFAQEHIVEVGPPPAGIASDPEVSAAAQSVVKVRGENRCGQGVEGSGFLYSPNRVMTNAHVVAGVGTPHVLVGDQEASASVVYYNPQIDVAVLAVEDLGRRHLSFDRSGRTGEAGAVLGYPQDGPYDVEGARIRARQRLSSPDIYDEGTVIREVFSVRSTIRPGNSGGPLVSPAGKVLGVVFAASVTDGATGYALTADQVAQAAAKGQVSSAAVSSGRCG